MQVEFEMNMMGELKFFLGLQIKKIDRHIHTSIKVREGTFEEV